MRAVIVVDITVTVMIEGNWGSDCELQQIYNDADKASAIIASRIHRRLDDSDKSKMISTKRSVNEIVLKCAEKQDAS